ncbi:hypothetical protein ABK040_006846 [Willaertia magna]
MSTTTQSFLKEILFFQGIDHFFQQFIPFYLEYPSIIINLFFLIFLITFQITLFFIQKRKLIKLEKQINENQNIKLTFHYDVKFKTCQQSINQILKKLENDKLTTIENEEQQEQQENKENEINIIAIGAHQCKTSIKGENDSLQPTVIGLRKDRGFIGESSIRNSLQKNSNIFSPFQEPTLYGKDALNNRAVHKLNYPIKKQFEKILLDTKSLQQKKEKYFLSFNEFEQIKDLEEFLNEFLFKKIKNQENLLFISLPFYLYYNKDHIWKEKLIEKIFEEFNFNKFYCSLEQVLPIYSVGKYDGLTVDIGNLFTSILPVVNGVAIKNSLDYLTIGGLELENIFEKMLLHHQCIEGTSLTFNSSNEREILREIKEKLTFVKNNDKEERSNCYLLPDSTELRITDKEILSDCNEYLFNFSYDNTYYKPTLNDNLNLQNCIVKCIKDKCKNQELRELCYNNIVLNGGCTMIDGFTDRLCFELSNELNKEKQLIRKGEIYKDLDSIGYLRYYKQDKDLLRRKVNITSREDRVSGILLGAKILSSLSSFNDLVVTREMYDEYGPSIVNKHFVM